MKKDIKDTIKTIIADKAVNTGRQPELDLVKAVFIVLFPLMLIPEMLVEDVSSPLCIVANTILDGCLASPALIFLIGVSLVFSSRKSFDDLFGRGIMLFVAGIALIYVRLVFPSIAAYYVTGDFVRFIEPLKYLALSNDIFTFAALSIITMGLFVKYDVNNHFLLASGVVLSLLGNLFIGFDSGIPFLNIALGYLIGIEDADGSVISNYPFFNWFIVVVLGYLFGKSLIRVCDKKRFYGIVTAPCLIIGTAYLVYCCITGTGSFGEGWYSYVHIRFVDAIFEILLVVGLIGLAYYVDRLFSDKLRQLVSRISRSITWAYAINCTLITWICIAAYIGGYYTYMISVPGLLISSLILSVALTALSVNINEKIRRISKLFPRRKRSIGRRILKGLLIFAVSIALFGGYFVGVEYWSQRIDEITRNSQAINEACAVLIDPDIAIEYYKGKEPDEYYYMIQEAMDRMADMDGIEYIYVIKPDYNTESYTYIWDTDVNANFRFVSAFEADAKELGVYDGSAPRGLLYNYQVDYGNMATAVYPVYTQSGELLVICTEVSVHDIMNVIIRFVGVILISVLSLLVIAIGIFYYSIRKNIIKPIDELNCAVNDMVNQLEETDSIDIGITTGDEIEALSHNYENMFLSTKSYMKSLADAMAERERMGAELSIAYDIQQAMLPKEFPKMPELELYAIMDPAKDVGGDFYDFYMLDESHLAFAVADVSGKGIPAALFMVIAKTLIRDNTTGDRSLGEVFEIVNNMLSKSNERGFFVTAFEGVLNLKTGELRYVNAGHEPPFIRRKDGSVELFKPLPGLVIACMEGAEYREGVIMLEPGDSFFEYTDGVTEATNSENELYGFDRLKNVLDNNSDKTAEALLDAIRADIDTFAGDAPQFDDITMLCFDFKNRMK